jgi:hypothetical protein
VPNFDELEVVVPATVTVIANTSALSPLSDLYAANVFPGYNNTLLWRQQTRYIPQYKIIPQIVGDTADTAHTEET